MRKVFLVIVWTLALFNGCNEAPKSKGGMHAQVDKPFGIVIHGGAGNLTENEDYTPHLKKLEEALNIGYSILERGGTSLEAVEAVIVLLEDSPLFNAGKGSVTNIDGDFELDASIMDGKTLKAGAVAGLHHIKNPIQAAKFVMEKTPHVLMIGEKAEKLLLKNGFQKMDKKYFMSYHNPTTAPHENKYGTVGAAALDKYGNLAAGTSTGGTPNKLPGRVGDSPIIGAGTYADNAYAAVSCTGQGEFFIRNVIAYDLIALIKYQNLPIEKAAHLLIQEKLKQQKGPGGLIAIDKNANIATSFNTTLMFKAFKNNKGQQNVSFK